MADRVRGRAGDPRLRRPAGGDPAAGDADDRAGRHISERGQTGVQVRLYSDVPFRDRPNGRPEDEFEWEALGRLREDPDEPVYRFEEADGRPVLRYATARRMQETCVRCHNTHPDSPKKDWKEGDVPGVLEVIRPLDGDEKRTRAGLRGTAVLMAVTFGSLLGASGLILVMTNRRRYSPRPDAMGGAPVTHGL